MSGRIRATLRRVYSIIAPNRPAAYAVALALVGTATLSRFLLDRWIPETSPFIFLTYFPAVLVAGAVGGLAPGLVAAAAAAVLSWVLFLPPAGVLSFDDPGGFAVIVFWLFASLTAAGAAELQAASLEVDRTLERLQSALDASGTGTWRWLVQSDRVEWDEALAKVYGIAPDQAPRTAAEFMQRVHPADRDSVGAAVASALACGDELVHEFRTVLPDGRTRWIYDRSRVVRNREGAAVCLIGACMDISSRKEAEELKSILIDELKHRMKNTLAVVQSLARLSIRGAKNFAEFEESFGGRIAALSAAQALLTGSSWRRASLRDVLVSQTGAYDRTGSIALAGPDIVLAPKQAMAMGLVGYELMTNAVKHGALSKAGGTVRVTWTRNDGSCRLLWQEDGGPPPKSRAKTGFGSRLIEIMASDIEGEVETKHAAEGVIVALMFPIDPSLQPAASAVPEESAAAPVAAAQ